MARTRVSFAVEAAPAVVERPGQDPVKNELTQRVQQVTAGRARAGVRHGTIHTSPALAGHLQMVAESSPQQAAPPRRITRAKTMPSGGAPLIPVDGEIAMLASPTGSGYPAAPTPPDQSPGALVKWRSKDPRSGTWMDYDNVISSGLEDKFQKGRKAVKIRMHGIEFQIDLTPGAMRQYNTNGMPREVERVVAGAGLERKGSLPAGPGRPRLVTAGAAEGYSPVPLDAAQGRQRAMTSAPGSMPLAAFSSPTASTPTSQFAPAGGFNLGRAIQSSPAAPINYAAYNPYDTPTPSAQLVSFGMGAATPTPSAQPASFGATSPTSSQQSGTASIGFNLPTPSSASGGSLPVLASRDKSGAITWKPYQPNPKSILVIGPGGGTRMNAEAYQRLKNAGWDLTEIHAPDYDRSAAQPDFLYPPGWETNTPDLNFNNGKNLATLADQRVAPTIAQLVAAGRGPVAVIAGSRGGQVTIPRLWASGWRGPTIVVNGGCIKASAVPPLPVRLVMITGGQDYFETKNPKATEAQLRKEDASQPVLLYHDPLEGHMPQHYRDVLGPLLEIACSEDKFAEAARAPAGSYMLPGPARRHGIPLRTL